MYKPKKCPICGEEFIPKSAKQKYCKKPIDLICPICGDKYEGLCQPQNPTTCNKAECKKKAGYAGQLKNLSKRVCKICGAEFQPVTANQFTCNRQIEKVCVMCGKVFADICAPWHDSSTCSDECKNKLSAENKKAYWSKLTRVCKWCGKPFNPSTNSQVYCEGPHYKTCAICGKQFEINASIHDERVKMTCSEECASIHKSKILNSSESRENHRLAMLEKYGVEYPAQLTEFLEKQKQTMLERYGVTAPYYLPSFKSKAIRNAKASKLELHICKLLDNYGIEYERHYIMEDGEYAHEFDFFIPEYKLLLDADGVYYHSYISDPDGERVRDDYDEIRLSLIPEDHIFHVIVEGNEDDQVKDVVNQIESIKGSLSEYNSILFDWCRSIDFPFPNYDAKRLLSDWSSLCKYENNRYIPQCRLGESIIKHHHKSIYKCHVGSNIAPVEAWNDDTLLKKVIRNRLIYINNVDPSKVLSGFNISKICPIVSIFNPVLTKYIIRTYLNEYSEIFDPFSGFSGRLLGAASLGKAYIGQDLNLDAVAESQEIIDFLKLDRAKYSISQQDVLESTGQYECLLTCPPYNKKEIYNKETVFKTCDEWIDECLDKFKCKRYVFVVDHTDKHSDCIVETISNCSHFSKSKEYIVVIDSPVLR